MRSLTIREEIEINAPVGGVWDLFRDLEAWPRWNPTCHSAAWISGPSWARGSAFRLRLRMAGLRPTFRVRVVEDDVPWAVGWTSTVLGVTEHRRFEFDFLGRTTVVIDTMTFTSPILPLRLFYPRPLIRAMSRAWLRALKAEVEGRGPMAALAGPRGW